MAFQLPAAADYPVIRRCNQLAEAAQDVVQCALLRLDMCGESGLKPAVLRHPSVPFPFALILGDLSCSSVCPILSPINRLAFSQTGNATNHSCPVRPV
jgi:hypothetical protein